MIENENPLDSHLPEKKTGKGYEDEPVDMEVIRKGIKELLEIRQAAIKMGDLISIEKIIENYQKGIPGLTLDENAPQIVEENLEKIASFFSSENAIFSHFKNEFLKLGVDAVMKDKSQKNLLLDTRDLFEEIQTTIIVFSEGKEKIVPYLKSLKTDENKNLGINHDHASQVIKRLIATGNQLADKVEDVVTATDTFKSVIDKK